MQKLINGKIDTMTAEEVQAYNEWKNSVPENMFGGGSGEEYKVITDSNANKIQFDLKTPLENGEIFIDVYKPNESDSTGGNTTLNLFSDSGAVFELMKINYSRTYLGVHLRFCYGHVYAVGGAYNFGNSGLALFAETAGNSFAGVLNRTKTNIKDIAKITLRYNSASSHFPPGTEVNVKISKL